MMTSNFRRLSLLAPPAAAVCIARGKPRLKGGWMAHLAAGVSGRNFDALVPTWAALKGTDAEYDRAFAAILKGLDPATVYAELGEHAVLLCHCKPGEFCHRRLVAEWFEFHLGIIVPELGLDRRAAGIHTTPTYDHWIDRAQKREQLEKQLAGKSPIRLGPPAPEAHKHDMS